MSFENLADVASTAVGRLLKEGPLNDGKLRFAWRLAVGQAIDRVSSVSTGPGGQVIVTVTDARWKKEIARSRAAILQKLTLLLGQDAVRKMTVKDE